MSKARLGHTIRGPKWPEPVVLNLIEEDGDFIHIVGVTKGSGEHIDQVIRKEEFQEVVIEDDKIGFSEEAWKVFLAIETLRYRFASIYDPLLAMNTSKVDPLPHQIEAVYGYILKLPRIRFLIADDPGAGKTIMAGLIIKELKLRQLAKRILIVTPGHLKDQWKRELAERFEESFEIVDRYRMDSSYKTNVWLRENQIITSIDFAKRDDVRPSLIATDFDLIIVDEAHKMSAYKYGDKIEKSDRYRLGEVLSNITNHLLFLTATPHKGDPENFRLFLDLLEPGFFASNEMVLESIQNKDNPLFIRRVKEDLKDFNSKPIFLPRHVKTISLNLGIYSPKEKELYNELSRYVNFQYNKALQKDKRHNIAFALVILQRRLASSTYALLRSLERRKERLEELIKRPLSKESISEPIVDYEVIEDMPEQERWKEEELWETISVAENIEFTVDEDYVSRVKENLGETLATRYIDYTRIKEMAQQAKELRLIPEYTENYFKKAFTRAGGRFKEKGKGFLSIEGIPYEIRRLADEEDFKKGFGTVLKRYPKITFDKELAFKTPDAEFVSFGHPLFEAILIWVETTLMDSINNGAVFYDPDRRFDGYILFYEGEIKDGTGAIAGKRLFSFYDNGKEVTPVTPSVVWDLIEGEINQVGDPVDFSELKKRVTYKAITKLEEYKEELLKERNRQAEIKEKYGIKSLEHLIIKLDHELIGLYERKEAQENVDIAIRNKGEKKADYAKALGNLKELIKKEKSLTMTMPKYLGIIKVKPIESPHQAMRSDAEIERIGMEIAMKFEIKNGRTPEDVSSQNLGFDIRSIGRDGKIRYVEVKARAQSGDIALTQNEWFKAQRFKEDYYLYVVYDASKSPQLFIIQNPAERLRAQEKVEIVRFIIDGEDVIKTGEVVRH